MRQARTNTPHEPIPKYLMPALTWILERNGTPEVLSRAWYAAMENDVAAFMRRHGLNGSPADAIAQYIGSKAPGAVRTATASQLPEHRPTA